MDLDIGGFLTSAEFLSYIATVVATLLSGLFQTLLGGLLGAS
jgi:hypothetical protein